MRKSTLWLTLSKVLLLLFIPILLFATQPEAWHGRRTGR
jgi:hypothetical protein